MQQATAPFYRTGGLPSLPRAATEPVSGVDSIPINPDHKPFADRGLGKKKKRRVPSPEDQRSPDSGDPAQDSEHHIDEYA